MKIILFSAFYYKSRNFIIKMETCIIEWKFLSKKQQKTIAESVWIWIKETNVHNEMDQWE